MKSALYIRQENGLTDILTYTKPPNYRPSKNVFVFLRRFCFCGRNKRQSIGDEFRRFRRKRCSSLRYHITGYVNLFSVRHMELSERHNSVTAIDTKCPLRSSRRCTLPTCTGLVNVYLQLAALWLTITLWESKGFGSELGTSTAQHPHSLRGFMA